MSFISQTRERSSAVLPMAAMVDVLFLLLIFFMVASVFRDRESQIAVSLPATESSQTSSPGTQIVITVSDDGSIHMGDTVYNLRELRQTLVALAQQYPEETVVIRGDQDSKLGVTVKVMDIAYYDAKLRNVYLATTKLAGGL